MQFYLFYRDAMQTNNMLPQQQHVHLYCRQQQRQAAPEKQDNVSFFGEYFIQQKICWLKKHRCELSGDYVFRISQDYKSFSDGKGCEAIHTIIEFILDKYDKKRLIEFNKKPGDLESIFECVSDVFRQRWIEYIDKVYFAWAGYMQIQF